MKYAEAPLLLEQVFDNPQDVVELLERHAPYTPLGGWYRPDLDPDEPVNALWFQNDWVHAGYRAEGSELFLHHQPYFESAREFYGAEVVVPHSVYVNMMAALPKAGPAHTDNPKFRGRERANTPMWLLRMMLWSELFERWEIVQATAIWWLSDVEEGGLAYWANGPDQPPSRHVGNMANTALVGDNHKMFHQVEAAGPFDRGMPLVDSRAELAPTGEGDWAVMDCGKEVYRAPLSDYRVSVLWKADIYASEAERQRVQGDTLSMADVVAVFNEDLAGRGESVRLDLEQLDQPELQASMAAIYPEARPLGAKPSIYEGY